LSAPVRQALATVPRHRFVADEQRGWAYADMPLPIGRGQTISQPFIVALMTELLALDPAMTILEIGAGSGYQTAVLAQLARQVYSVERIPELAEAAAQRWREMGIENVALRVGDGGQGWEEYAPLWDHGDGGGDGRSASLGATTETRRATGDSGGGAGVHPGFAGDPQGPAGCCIQPQRVAGGVRAVDPGSGLINRSRGKSRSVS
jgi:hypothetical protein